MIKLKIRRLKWKKMKIKESILHFKIIYNFKINKFNIEVVKINKLTN